MSITYELREWWVRKFPVMDKELHRDFTAIADRIDAEHERECKEQYACGVEHGIGASIDASMIQTHGYVELPNDADGVPIHIGDMMEGVDKYDSLKKVMGKVITISFESDGPVDVAVQAWNDDGKSWYRAYLDQNASVYRHYHDPTVEDVLRGVVTLCHNTWKEGSAFEFYDVDDVMKSGNIAEYAAKLRLAGDAE